MYETYLYDDFLRPCSFGVVVDVVVVAAAAVVVLCRRLVLGRLLRRRWRPVELSRIGPGVLQKNVYRRFSVFVVSVFFQEPESAFGSTVVAAVVVGRGSGRRTQRLVQDVSEEVSALADLLPPVVDRHLAVVVLQRQLLGLVQLRVVVPHGGPGALGVVRGARRGPRTVTPVTTVTAQVVALDPNVLLLASQGVELVRAGRYATMQGFHRT